MLQQWALIEFPMAFSHLMALGRQIETRLGDSPREAAATYRFRMKGALEVPIAAQSIYVECILTRAAHTRSFSILSVTPQWNAGPLPFFPVGFTATREFQTSSLDVTWWYVKEFLHERVDVKASGKWQRFFENSVPGRVAEIEAILDQRFAALAEALERSLLCAHCWPPHGEGGTAPPACDDTVCPVRSVDGQEFCLELPTGDGNLTKMAVLFVDSGTRRRLARLRLEVPTYLLTMPGTAGFLDADNKWRSMSPLSAWGGWVLEVQFDTRSAVDTGSLEASRYRVVDLGSGIVLFDAAFDAPAGFGDGQSVSMSSHIGEFKRAALNAAEITATNLAGQIYLVTPNAVGADLPSEIRGALESLSKLESHSESRRSFHVLRLSVLLGERQPVIDAFERHFGIVGKEFGSLAASRSAEDFLRWLLRRNEEDLFGELLERWRGLAIADSTTESLFNETSDMIARRNYWGARELAAHWLDKNAAAHNIPWTSRFQSLIARTHIASLAYSGNEVSSHDGGELPSTMRLSHETRLETARAAFARALQSHNELNDFSNDLDAALYIGLEGMSRAAPGVRMDPENQQIESQ